MISRLEILPNELFFFIFSYLSWNEILTSFWSINERFDFLVCSAFTTNQTGILINQTGLSYKIFSSKFFQSITNCPSFISAVRRVHLDGRYSNGCEFYNHTRPILQYPNLQSLILTQCYLSESLIDNLSWLIEHRLNALTLILDEDIFDAYEIEERIRKMIPREVKKRLLLFKDLVRQLFSRKCQLISLRLDIPRDEFLTDIYQCLSLSDDRCRSLRYLHVRVHNKRFLEILIEHTPNLERLSVYLEASWVRNNLRDSSNNNIRKSYQDCSNSKLFLPKLKCFILKSVIENVFQLNYLKWIFNNLNHVEKLQISLQITEVLKNDSTINVFVIDANFLRRYFLADTIINLIYFDFDIISKCELSSNNIEKIIHSFQVHPFFIEHQWTNVACVYDSTNSYQHLSSSSSNTHMLKYFKYFKYNLDIFHRPHVKYVQLELSRTNYLLLAHFDQLFPHVSCIQFRTYCMPTIDNSDDLTTLCEIEQYKRTNIHLQYVTRLDIGLHFQFDRASECYERDVDRCKERSRLLVCLISMPHQLKYLRIKQFQWLVDVIKYSFDQLKKNALNTVKYVEFSLPSCNSGTNESTGFGKCLVPFLRDYMPHLEILHLWRPDDFPWTSLRPHLNPKRYGPLSLKWDKSLETLQSINDYTNIFEKDLSQLIENLKQFVYLDIRGAINQQKLETYRSMLEKRFPNTYFSIEIARFRFWI